MISFFNTLFGAILSWRPLARIRKETWPGYGPPAVPGSGYRDLYGHASQDSPGMLTGVAGRINRTVRSGRADSSTCWRKRGLCAAGLLAILLLVTLLVRGPVLTAIAGISSFKVRDIVISGCRMTTPTQIREQAGLGYHLNLIKIDLPAFERKIGTHPWVQRATVRREWPDVLRVDVHEYRPEAIISFQEAGAESFHYVDRSGVVFSPVMVGQDIDFPVITGFRDQADVENRQGQLVETLTFIKLARQNNPNLPWQNVSEIAVDREGGLVLYLVEKPFPIYLGHGDVNRKYSRLKRVLEVLYGKSKSKMGIADVAYIRMDYQQNKVLVAQSAVN